MSTLATPPLAAVPAPRYARPRCLLHAGTALLLALVCYAVDERSAARPLASVALGLAARWYELARFPAVHRSGFLMLLAWFSAVYAGIDGLVEPSPRLPWLAPLAAVLVLGHSFALFASQRREHDPRQDGIDWPLGGFLLGIALLHVEIAVMSLRAILGVGVLTASSGTGIVLCGAVLLLVLQMRRSRWFVSISRAVAWTLIAASAVMVFLRQTEIAHALLYAYPWSLFVLAYTFAAPRARRTFAPRP